MPASMSRSNRLSDKGLLDSHTLDGVPCSFLSTVERFAAWAKSINKGRKTGSVVLVGGSAQ